MAVRGTVDANAGGSLVSSVTGTANQVTASPTTGAVVVGLAAISQIGTSLAIGGATIGTDALGVTGTSTFGGVVTNNSGGFVVANAAKATAYVAYNTADQVTNFEKVTLNFSGNIFNIDASMGGAGTAIRRIGIGQQTLLIDAANNNTNSSGKLTFTAATSGIVLKQGANGLCGTFVANGATPVVVSNTNVAITDTIIISLNTIGGTVGVQPHVSAITGSTSFAVTCTAVDTSTYNYAIIKNAA